MIVVYRRPIEARAADVEDRADLVFMVVVDLAAEFLGRDVDEIDPPPVAEIGTAAQTARRLSRRRSRSDSPPQMPKRSSCSRAYSRHSPRTSQPVQIFFASRVEPPFSGKNASGSVWEHSARSCQLASSGSPKMSASSSVVDGAGQFRHDVLRGVE